MTDRDLLLAVCEHLHICSRLLTAAAMRLSWDSDVVESLVAELRDQVFRVEARLEEG